MRGGVCAVDLSQTIGEIYAAAHDPTHWNAAIGSIRHLLDGSKACLVPSGPGIAPEHCISDTVASEMNQLLFTDMLTEFRMFEARVTEMPVGLVYQDHVIYSLDTPLRKTRFWQEWMAPQDMYGGIGCRILETRSGSWLFDIQRGARQPDFDDHALAIVRLLAPHLRQAMTLSQRAGLGARALESLECLPFGMMLVDSHLKIHQANGEAERLVADRHSPLLARRGKLVPARDVDGLELRRRIAEACPADRLTLPVAGSDVVLASPRSPGEGLVVSVAPIGATGGEHRFTERLAAVAIRRFGRQGATENLEPLLSRAYGLSAREASLAASLVSGRTLRETAERNAIAFSTARSYLEAIFVKTGTRRQGELIALARNLEPLLRTPTEA